MNDNYTFLATDAEPDNLDTFPLPAGVSTAEWRYKANITIAQNEELYGNAVRLRKDGAEAPE